MGGMHAFETGTDHRRQHLSNFDAQRLEAGSSTATARVPIGGLEPDPQRFQLLGGSATL